MTPHDGIAEARASYLALFLTRGCKFPAACSAVIIGSPVHRASSTDRQWFLTMLKKKCFRALAPSKQLYVTMTTELLILLLHIWGSCDSPTKVAFPMVELGPFIKSINAQKSVLNSNVPLYVNQTSQFLTFIEVLKPAKRMKMRYTELSWLTCTVHVWLFFCQC